MDNVKELASALAAAQGKVENAKKLNNNPHFKSKYADLATIWDVIREPLTSEGLSVLQLPCEAPQGQVGLVTHVLHRSGQTVSERFYLGLKDASNPQQVGSALTYMKRYALLGVAGIASEDDDGNAATGRPSPTIATQAIDWGPTVKETMERLAGCKEDSEKRQLYQLVRASSIDEPHKTQLLTQMYEAIKASANASTAAKNVIVDAINEKASVAGKKSK